MTRRSAAVRRSALALGALVTLAAGSLSAPAGSYAAPASQVLVEGDNALCRAAESAARAASDGIRAWPAAYEYYRPRPPYGGGDLQRLYPWEMLGSPFVPVWPLGEVRFADILPADDDYNYGALVRNSLTPLAFRLNCLEAEPYINAGMGGAVLLAWARYLGRSPAELARPPATAEELTRVIRGWLRDAGYLVEAVPSSGQLQPTSRP